MTGWAVFRAFLAITGVNRMEQEGNSQVASITRPRHELMYILRQLTAESFSNIGVMLGGRDMATVHAGVWKVAALVHTDPAYHARMADLIAKIRNAPEGDLSATAGWRWPALRAVLLDPQLTDAEARQVALSLLRNEEALHGS